ncbi:MAG TPA: UDP-N-acetylmuramoyl-L-alanyl-D-glutamate--2,6-diaminopimelate ligase [Halanaerobiaceae bacterium]|nr:UDP-N-acetylmuramoyl-L-alanyl-D-glutamate--2,6-diaminopimelate ligase [Halanaerobiaceae bacterium]
MEEVVCQEKLPLIKGVTCDSREVKPGYAFVAINGFQTDGNRFINEAIEKGARIIFTEKISQNIGVQDPEIPIIQVDNAREYLAYLAAQYYNHPSKKLDLIGITGTNGKTTSTHLLYHLFNYSRPKKEKKVAGLIGTVNVDTGKRIIPGNLTTPDPVTLQAYLREMLNEGCKYVCMEVSSHGIKLKRIAETEFAVKVGTNLSADHFDLHPDFEDYVQVKREFLEEKGDSLVLLNQDNKYIRSFGKIAEKQINFSIRETNDVCAKNIKSWQRGHSFIYQLNRYLINENKDFIIKPCEIPIKTNLPGEHNIYNSLIAITIALYYNIPPETIQDFFQNFQGVWRRLEYIYDKDFTIIDDCAHNPGSYAAVFNSVLKMNYNKLIIVNSLRGNRGTLINKKNAETLCKYLPRLKKTYLLNTNCADVAKKIDLVSKEEEKVFRETLKKHNIEASHYQRLRPALEKALELVGENDIILLLGPHAMDIAGKMILEIM